MAVEYRGCRNLVYAEVTSDDNETDGGYKTGEVKKLAPLGEISKTVETSSEAKYYDNVPAIVISGEGSDTVTFTIAIPSDEVLADISGRVYDVAVDLRKNSPTYGKWFGVELDGIKRQQFLIPRGFAHGFSVLSETAVFTYKCDNLYAPGAEGGIRFDDPTLGIDWQIPEENRILSEKDLKHPFFKDHVSNFEM